MSKVSLDENEIIESTQYIIGEAAHMRNIANSLLELATLRDYVPVKSEIQIAKLFSDVAGTLEQSLRENGTELICESSAEVIYAQEDLVRSLLLNLCTNALAACTQGEGIIRLEARESDEQVTISVTDNGYGIPKESLHKITEPFYRLDQSRTRESGGTGLGLALCRQIAEVHGAKMSIESAPGEGTAVEIIYTTSKQLHN
jgi:signal transduction histidine kinase